MEHAPLVNENVNSGFRLNDTSLHAIEGITILQSSEELHWQNLYAALTEEAPHEALHEPVPDIWLSMVLEDVNVSRTIDADERQQTLAPYQITIAAPKTSIEVYLKEKTKAFHVFLKKETLLETASELYGINNQNVEVLSSFGKDDLSTSWILRSIKQTLLDRSDKSDLKINYLSHALAIDLLKKYCICTEKSMNTVKDAELTARQMHRVIAYMKENISETVQLKELSSAAGLSRNLFIDRFKCSTRQTPHQYLLDMRVRHGRYLLKNSSMPIQEIALNCGFSDQAHFCTVFKRKLAMTPLNYRRTYS